MIIWPLKADCISYNELEQTCPSDLPVNARDHHTSTQVTNEDFGTQVE